MKKSLWYFLFKKESRRKNASLFFLLLSLSLGIAALVAIEGFARRIESTVKADSRKLLAADYQITAWREFDETVWQGVAEERERGEALLLRRFLTTIFWGQQQENTLVSVRAVEPGRFPFYGEFVTEPQISTADLEKDKSIIVDKSFRARGVKLGDEMTLGEEKFKVAAFLIEEPQSATSVFSLGGTVFISLKWLDATGLSGTGARIFNQLLVKSSLSQEAFRKKFRAISPDPHWRIMTPARVNRQSERVIDRLNAFLSFVALSGLLLGSVGLFMVFRSIFLRRLPSYLTLRCLGASRASIIFSALAGTLKIVLGSWLLGSSIGIFFERLLYNSAQTLWDLKLVETSMLPSFVWALALSLLCVLVAVLLPLREVLRVPVSEAIRQSESQRKSFTAGDALIVLGALFAVVFLFSPVLKTSFILFGGIVLAIFLLLGFGLLSSRLLSFPSKSFAIKHAKLQFLRKFAQSQLLLVSLGLSLFFVYLILFLGAGLKQQLDFSERDKIPNLFVLGVPQDSLVSLRGELPQVESVAVAQMRIMGIKGREYVAAEDPEELEGGQERFYQSREYTVTRRNALALGETLVRGPDIFGEATAGVVRVSVEERFADRLKLKLGDELSVDLAGVGLTAQVRSIRRVDWYNFNPNFFFVLSEEDVALAPMDYVAFARVEKEKIPDYQRSFAQKFPHLTVLDGDAVAVRLLKILDQLSFTVLAVSMFSLMSCVFVFIGIFLSRRIEVIKDLALWRSLGLHSHKAFLIYFYEVIFSSSLAVLSAFSSAMLVLYFVCRWVMDIPMYYPHVGYLIVPLVVLPLLSGAGVYLILRSVIHKPTVQLLQLAEES